MKSREERDRIQSQTLDFPCLASQITNEAQDEQCGKWEYAYLRENNTFIQGPCCQKISSKINKIQGLFRQNSKI